MRTEDLLDGVSVMVAARNEERQLFNTVGNIIEGAQRANFQAFEIIIFDDGSTDRTTEIAEELAARLPFVRVIRNAKSQGLGALFVRALDEARFSKLTFFAGDNNAHAYLAEVIFRNWDQAEVVVSYFLNVEHRSRFRVFLSALYTLVFNTVFGLSLKYVNGNSIYPISLLKELALKDNCYGIWAEVLVKALRKGATFYEVAGYANPDGMNSQALSLRTLRKIVSAFLRLVWVVYIAEKETYRHGPRRLHVPPYQDHHAIPGRPVVAPAPSPGPACRAEHV